jgi:hypothetical protein
MSDVQLDLKPVHKLLVDAGGKPVRYRIAAYQRGYRWTPQQVTQLLEDIHEFTQRENPQPEDFYCLQPLVVKHQEDGALEVVDGQQRLTTLLLILRYFNARMTEEFRDTLFTLEYETRRELLSFLENPSDERAAGNIDFFHIDRAINTIKSWFHERRTVVEDMKSAFLNKTKVIWYVLSPSDSAVEAFTRLNVGKIPLTNGELIRALFLRRDSGGSTDFLRLRIAYEWDLLEKGLQRDDFWFFLSNDSGEDGNRIGFLFDLVARAEGMPSSSDAYATFYHYSDKLNAEGSDPEQAWLAITDAYTLLEEWFDDRRLYHLVGFLIWEDADINELLALAAGTTKKAMRQALRQKIFRLTVGDDDLTALTPAEVEERIADRVDLLQYGRNSQIGSILLLFNLATLLQSRESNMRFQFESFKTFRWDIEHIRSVASDQPGSRTGRIEWLEHCAGYFEATGQHQELRTEIQQFIGLPHAQATDAVFEVLYEKVLKAFQESDGEPDDSLANLALLDARTNRSYKNAPFAVKRRRVLSLDRDGIFVPLCTRNVFLKAYSALVDHTMFWTQTDKDAYRKAMISVLGTFFTGGWIDD